MIEPTTLAGHMHALHLNMLAHQVSWRLGRRCRVGGDINAAKVDGVAKTPARCRAARCDTGGVSRGRFVGSGG